MEPRTFDAGAAGTTLVWIDAHAAIVVSWQDRARVEIIPFCVRSEDRAHGESWHGFLADVVQHVPEGRDVRVVGPGAIRDRLERHLQAEDRRRRRARRVLARASDGRSEEELVERVRGLAGDAATSIA